MSNGTERYARGERSLKRLCCVLLPAVLFAWPALGAPAARVKAADKTQVAAVSQSEPLQIPLNSMGFQTLQQDFLLSGSSMLTVHFVDRTHLMVTFGVRRLMKREAENANADQDRTVRANLVELPSGKVLAQTEWRLHDHSQYLWALGRGRFVLRIGDRVSMVAPLAAVGAEAFHEYPLLTFDGHLVGIFTSPDDDLLTVETTKFAMAAGETTAGFSFDAAPVEMNFFRLVETGTNGAGLAIVSAGKIRTQTAITLPLTAAGRLEVVQDGKDRWLFNFDEHSGKVDELAGFETTCFPRPTLIGSGEFVAFGCRGADNNIDLAGFNMKGEEMWQQSFYDPYVAPTFAFAPSAGRFALGRTLVNTALADDVDLSGTVVTGQEVRVYQNYNGRQLLKVEASPVERAGQNFALSPDGMQLAVVREEMVHHAATKDEAAYAENEAELEIYTLPPLGADDLAAVKEAQAHAPLDTGARIDVALARTAGQQQKPVVPEPPNPTVAGGVHASSDAVVEPSAPAPPAGDAIPTAAAARTIEEGDVQPTGPRAKPTLYGPDEAQPDAAKPETGQGKH
jgi:hypothetical protein